MSVGGLVLGTGTSACFQAVGTIPWRIEQLKIAHNGSAIATLRNHANTNLEHYPGHLLWMDLHWPICVQPDVVRS